MSTRLVMPVLVLACLLAAAVPAHARDRDRDGLPDRWEKRHHLSTSKKSGRGDPDHDRLSNRREYRLRTAPRRRDTDRDGLRDGAEVRRYKTNPRRKDTDGDGLRDGAEVRRYKTNPRRKDTDGDGLGDGAEVRRYKTDPRRRDTDGDGFTDGAEVLAGTNPRDPNSRPASAGAPAATVPADNGFGGPVGPQPETFTCDRTATTASFASEVGAATPGQTVCLVSGTYGTWGGTNKAITVRAAAGAAVTMRIAFDTGETDFTLAGITVSGGEILNGARNLTVRNCVFTQHLRLDGLANSNILLANNAHNNINATQSTSPGRIHLSWTSQTHSGVTIRSSLLVGGDSDGVQSGVGVNIVGNEFRDIRESGGTNHTDNIQLLDAPGSVVRGNYVHSTAPGITQGIAAYDGLQRSLIEDNVVAIPRAAGIEVYSDSGSTIRHNTLQFAPPGCRGSAGCGIIDVNRKTSDPAGTGTVVVDNVATSITVVNGSSVALRRNNLVRRSPAPGDFVGVPIFAGGALPAGWTGYTLAGNSIGNNAATDGTDVGIRP